jgi:hypothetical protein
MCSRILLFYLLGGLLYGSHPLVSQVTAWPNWEGWNTSGSWPSHAGLFSPNPQKWKPIRNHHHTNHTYGSKQHMLKTSTRPMDKPSSGESLFFIPHVSRSNPLALLVIDGYWLQTHSACPLRHRTLQWRFWIHLRLLKVGSRWYSRGKLLTICQ